jgi:hypothetical protein
VACGNRSPKSRLHYQALKLNTALSETVKDARFIVNVVESLSIKVETPITVKVDNIGTIFMAENMSAISRTKHIDIRYHFVCEFVEEGFVKVVFVKTTENKSDMFTKNVSGEAYDEHIDNYIMDCKDIACNGWTTWEGVRSTHVAAAVVLPCHRVFSTWREFTCVTVYIFYFTCYLNLHY